MNYPLFFFLLLVILVAFIVIAKQSPKKPQDNLGYFLSNRSLSAFKVSMTILATQLGGGAIIGTAEAAYNHGWAAMSYSAGLALGLLVLACGMGAKFRKMEVGTVPEIFEKYYKSNFLRTFSSVLYIASMFLILVAIGVSARKFSLSIGLGSEITYIIFWLVMIAYTSTGGLTAVTKTDILQVIFILLAFIITILFLINSDIWKTTVPFVSRGDSIPWLSWLVIPCFFAVIGQDMAQRCFASQSSKAISLAALVAAILLLMASALPVYLGIIANKLGFEAIKGGSVLIDIVAKTTTPYVASIFACSILMAILSTADSLLCAISSNISLDFKLLKTKAIRGVSLSKAITVIIGLLAMVCSYIVDAIIPMMLLAYEVSVSALSAPVIMTIALSSPSKFSAYASSLIGILTYIFCGAAGYQYKEIWALALSFAAFALVELYMRLKGKI